MSPRPQPLSAPVRSTRIAISDQVKERASAESARGFTDCDLRPLRGRLAGVHVFAL